MAKGKVVFTGAEQDFTDYYKLTERVCVNAKPDVGYLVTCSCTPGCCSQTTKKSSSCSAQDSYFLINFKGIVSFPATNDKSKLPLF